MPLTSKQVLDVFRQNGITPARWAEEMGFSKFLVYRVLKDPSRSSRGQSHRIAVTLGLKDGPLEPSCAELTNRINELRGATAKRRAA